MPRPTPRSRPLVGLVIVVALAVLAGCAVGPSRRPPVATRSDAPPVTQEPGAHAPPPAPPPLLPPLVPTRPAVDFQECTALVLGTLGRAEATPGRDLRLGCGVVPVRDGGPPGGGSSGRAELGVLRVTLGPVPAGGAVPVAVLGEAAGRTGTEQAVRLARRMPPDMLAGVALYGVDQRGTGVSEPVDCLTPSTREAIVDADPTADDPASLAPLQDAAATAARTCTQILENGLTDYSTATRAEDLDQVRRALGARRLNAIALGSGAGVLAEWARRYPGSVGRTVLDGPPDPTVTAAEEAEQRTRAARAALGAFATACTSQAGCPLGVDPVRAIGDILARRHAAPLIGLDGRRITDGTVLRALLVGLEDPSRWPATAAAVAAAGAGDPGRVLELLEPSETDGGGFDPALMNRCNDTAERLTLDQVAANAARARAADPLFGAYFAQRALLCSAWPVPTATPPLPDATGAPPLVLGTAADPRTPLPGVERVATEIPSATLVTWTGAGHGAFPATPCVTAAVRQYLRAGDLPPQGTVCPP